MEKLLTKRNSITLICILIATYILSNIIFYTKIIDTDLIFNSFSQRLGKNEIRQVDKKIHFIGLLYTYLIPIFFLVRLSAISFLIYVRTDLIGNFKLTWIKAFRITIFSEFILLIPLFIKIIWFCFINQNNYVLKDLSNFHFLSILNLLKSDSIPIFLLFPAKFVNLFEIAYWLFLAYLISKVLSIKYLKALNIILSSYVIGLIVFLALCMFLLSYSPFSLNDYY